MTSSIPLAVCLFTSTRGHFDIKTRWRETLDSLHAQIPLDHFAARFVNVKASPDEWESAVQMEDGLSQRGFLSRVVTGLWNHGAQNHQDQYLSDIAAIYNNRDVNRHQFCLHLEDDWQLHSFDGDLLRHFAAAIDILRKDPEVLSVRFPRFANERERIEGLKAKHGIDAKVENGDDRFFRSSDFSLNPSVFRIRDLKIASALFARGGHPYPNHVEHGLGQMLRNLSRSETPFAVLNPAKVKAAHRGTIPGQEDSLTEPLLAT